MKNMTANFIKITLAVLFFMCLFDLPYGYYQFVRFAGLVGFVILAYFSNQTNNKTATIFYVILAILFQPFAKIAIGRTLWNAVDVVVGIALIISIFGSKRK